MPTDQIRRQAIITERDELDPNQLIEEVVFFNPDGSPFEFPEPGPSTPVDLAAHIANHRPHQAAESGLNLASMYNAGRI